MATPSAGTPGGYAVVVSRQTIAEPEWKAVVDALVARHDGRVVPFSDSIRETLPAAETDVNGRTAASPKLSDKARAAGLTLDDARGLLFTEDVILVPNPRDCDPARKYRVRSTAKRMP
jgi:hypothetical protein